jgi:hypothetical protein
MQNGMATGEPYISVDVHSLAEAGRVIARLGTALSGATTLAQRQVQAGLASVPPSDLFEAYAFCWGRWSAVLDDAQRAVAATGGSLGGAGAHYSAVDAGVSRGMRAQ